MTTWLINPLLVNTLLDFQVVPAVRLLILTFRAVLEWRHADLRLRCPLGLNQQPL